MIGKKLSCKRGVPVLSLGYLLAKIGRLRCFFGRVIHAVYLGYHLSISLFERVSWVSLNRLSEGCLLSVSWYSLGCLLGFYRVIKVNQSYKVTEITENTDEH